jgi:hypothetical protein
MSSTNTNYTQGYKAATEDLAQFGNLGEIPVHNQKDFYLGIYQGREFASVGPRKLPRSTK